MTEPDGDVLRVFLDKLSPAARYVFDHHDLDTIRAIRTAVEHMTVDELARIASKGITRATVNGRGLMKYRLDRESGLAEAREEPMPPPVTFILDDAREAQH